MGSNLLGEVFFAMCKNVDTPKSLAHWLCYKYKSTDLYELTPRPDDYDNPLAFAKDYAVSTYVRKNTTLDFGIDRRAVAISKFIASENQCRETNRRLRSSAVLPEWKDYDPRINVVRRKIADVLGKLSIPAVLGCCRWGNGATATLRRARGRYDLKQCITPISVTTQALPYMRALIEADPIMASSYIGHPVEGPFCVTPGMFQLVESNVVDFVEKDARTERSIAKEPTANSFLQRGVGRYLRKRLKAFGIDLDNQGLNQAWASLALCLGLATIDLSAASDSVCRELIFLLFPLDWALFLDRLRTATGVLGGEEFYYQKFSSMGNGFTFELETLIFWAIVSAFQKPTAITSVYGDDIIMEAAYADEVIHALEYYGFTVNVEKSFTRGRFYESCGRHYFDGVDVTPVYQKTEVSEEIDRIKAHNKLVRWSYRIGIWFPEPCFESAISLLRRKVVEQVWAPVEYEGDDSYLIEPQHGLYPVGYDIHTQTFKALCYRMHRHTERRSTAQRGACAYWHWLASTRQAVVSHHKTPLEAYALEELDDAPEGASLARYMRDVGKTPQYSKCKKHQRVEVITRQGMMA